MHARLRIISHLILYRIVVRPCQKIDDNLTQYELRNTSGLHQWATLYNPNG